MAGTGTEIKTAYRKLKSYVYYDKTDLRLRARLDKFECSDKFEASLQAVQQVADAVNPSAVYATRMDSKHTAASNRMVWS